MYRLEVVSYSVIVFDIGVYVVLRGLNPSYVHQDTTNVGVINIFKRRFLKGAHVHMINPKFRNTVFVKFSIRDVRLTFNRLFF